jgi:citrate lyase beta subunit
LSNAAPNAIDGARSVWLTGGQNADVLEAALGSDADAVFADFEDMVPPDAKDTAREVVARLFTAASGPQLRIVRVNGPDHPQHADDMAALREVPVDAIIVPMATPEVLSTFGAKGPDLIALVETGQGVRCAYEMASMPRVKAFMIGSGDLSADLRIDRSPESLLYTRSKLVVDSAAAGIRAPFDVPSVSESDALEQECRYAQSLGMRGKLCVRPEQVEIVNRVFAP